MKRIFIAATKQNDGKTTVALGLIFNLKDRFKSIGFIKPIGQRYLEEEGVKVDEDSVLIERVAASCRLSCGLKDMSPLAVERGFTESYIKHPDKKKITEKIKRSFKRVSSGRQIVIIEGTGHAGVGSVFDHSNARVAKLLNSKVVLVSSGGIGRPIDEISLNKALFEKEKVKLAGVIINKVLPDKFEKINRLVRKGLRLRGVDVLGVVPYQPMLSCPTISQVLAETEFELISVTKSSLFNNISRIVIGAMEPQEAIKYIDDDSLLITPGDREDMLKAVTNLYRQGSKDKPKVSGIVLSGGMLPRKEIINALKEKSIPVLLAKADTYTVASAVHDLTVKIGPEDKHKIDAVIKLIKEHVDIDKILERI